MIQGNLFSKRIKDLRKEIRNLKTSHFKTATTINTMTLEKTVNFSLTLDNLTGEVYSTQRAIIVLAASDNSDMISACYVKNITPTNLDDRFVFVKRLDSVAGQARFDITVFSQNISDITTLSGGGLVNLSYTIQLIGSSKFTASVSYNNILGGS